MVFSLLQRHQRFVMFFFCTGKINKKKQEVYWKQGGGQTKINGQSIFLGGVIDGHNISKLYAERS